MRPFWSAWFDMLLRIRMAQQCARDPRTCSSWMPCNTAATATFREHNMQQRFRYVRRLEDMHLSSRTCNSIGLNKTPLRLRVSLDICDYVRRLEDVHLSSRTCNSVGLNNTPLCLRVSLDIYDLPVRTEAPVYLILHLYRSCCSGYTINSWRQAVSTPAMGSVPADSRTIMQSMHLQRMPSGRLYWQLLVKRCR